MFLQHITTEGERWDNIAYKYYGDSLAYEQIISVNPQFALTPHLPAGQVLLIPVLAESDAIAEELPAWLQ